jgi:hypothetical protein
VIDPDKVEEDKRFDGISVLRTNTGLSPRDAMLRYEQLRTTEQTFRVAKRLFSARSTLHGQVFCSFLALVLKKALEDRIAMLGRRGSWPEIIADLDSLTETEVEQDGKRFIVPLRTAPLCQPGHSRHRRRFTDERRAKPTDHAAEKCSATRRTQSRCQRWIKGRSRWPLPRRCRYDRSHDDRRRELQQLGHMRPSPLVSQAFSHKVCDDPLDWSRKSCQSSDAQRRTMSGSSALTTFFAPICRKVILLSDRRMRPRDDRPPSAGCPDCDPRLRRLPWGRARR